MRKRFFANGEPVTGSTEHAPYLRIAHTLLDVMKKRMKVGNLQQLAQQYTTETGVTIRAISRFGQDEIWIDVPMKQVQETVEQRGELFDGYFVWAAIGEQPLLARQYTHNGVPTGREITPLSNASFETMIVAHGALWGVGGNGAAIPDAFNRLVRYNIATGEGVEVAAPYSESGVNPASIVMTRNGVVFASSRSVFAANPDGSIRATRTFSSTEWSGNVVMLATDGNTVTMVVASSSSPPDGEVGEEGVLCLRVDDLSTVFETRTSAMGVTVWLDELESDLVYHRAGKQFHVIGSPDYTAWDDPDPKIYTEHSAGAAGGDLTPIENLGEYWVNQVSRSSHVSAGKDLIRIGFDGVLSTGGQLSSMTGWGFNYANYCAWDAKEFIWANLPAGLQKISTKTGQRTDYGSIGSHGPGAVAIQFWCSDPLTQVVQDNEIASAWATQHRITR